MPALTQHQWPGSLFGTKRTPTPPPGVDRNLKSRKSPGGCRWLEVSGGDLGDGEPGDKRGDNDARPRSVVPPPHPLSLVARRLDEDCDLIAAQFAELEGAAARKKARDRARERCRPPLRTAARAAVENRRCRMPPPTALPGASDPHRPAQPEIGPLPQESRHSSGPKRVGTSRNAFLEEGNRAYSHHCPAPRSSTNKRSVSGNRKNAGSAHLRRLVESYQETDP